MAVSISSESVAAPGGALDRDTGEIATQGVIHPVLTYALVTPARNEAGYIEGTIKSVVSQTIKPAKWVIVSDGSTDATDDIVKKYQPVNPWIELIRMPERGERHFAGKVGAFHAGYEKLSGIQYDIVGNLDADITFAPDYFEFLLARFSQNPRLGVAGTPFMEKNRTYDYRYVSVEHVSGACQLFRRECFESIGGYRPLKSGGIDLIAVTMARMKGWQTRCFLEKTCEHHRCLGSASRKGLRQFLHDGRLEYLLGVHPLWEIFRCSLYLTRSPYIAGGVCTMLGYLWAALREKRTVPPEVVAFRKQEHLRRLGKILWGLISFGALRRKKIAGSPS
jgi:glycosyltransferase involved in cell wall biosynthesis